MAEQLSLLQRIQVRKRLTQGEQKIVAYFKRNLNQLAFETVTSISSQTEVSKATVVRFIASLGYDGFPDFQQQLRDRLVQRMKPPISRLPLKKEAPEGENLLVESFSHIVGSLNETLANIDQETFLHIARLIARGRGRIFIEGHRSSGGLAQILWVRLQYLLSNVFLLNASALTVPDQLADVRDTDILFSITQSRYCDATRQIANYFADQGATVILLTDSEWMPYADKADYKLVASCEGLSMFGNCCSLLALIETLVLAVAQLCEDTARERSSRNEKLFQHFNTFATDLKNLARPVSDPMKPQKTTQDKSDR